MTTHPRNQIPHPVDVHVGAKVRVARKERGMSQVMLGDACGLTFQQIQKYERGANRISCSMLVAIARAMNVTPGYFVEDAPGALGELPLRDGWTDAHRIMATVPGAVEALYCLGEMPGEMRANLVGTLQIAAGRWPAKAGKAAA